MKIVPNTTEWLSMLERIKRQTAHAKEKKYIATNIDVADLELLLRELAN